MFAIVGRSVARMPYVFLAFWLLLLGGTWLAAPNFRDVSEDKGFGFLPPKAPSRVAASKFEQAFPDDPLTSNVVLVVRRETPDAKAPSEAKKFIENHLEPGLRRIAEEEGGLASEVSPIDEARGPGEPADDDSQQQKPRSIISRIRTPNAPGSGALYVSEDGRAALVVVDLTTDLLTHRNWATIRRIEKLVDDLQAEDKVPSGFEILLTGSAVIGRDNLVAQKDSASKTEFWTIALVIILLLVIYRAPLLALIPLTTVFLSVQLALHVLALAAQMGYVTLFDGIQIYIIVLTYGAGVDYCLFLTARYKEELDRGANTAEAVSEALHKVGAALTASAATVMCGIAMLVFARFGKFHEAGVVIPVSLLIVLCATLTFTSALLRLTGHWAFWPHRPDAKGETESQHLQWLWNHFAEVLRRRPGTIWLASVAVMAPFAIVAVLLSRHLTYDMVAPLPKEAPSVAGTRALQEHFPPGIVGPIAALLINPKADFRSKDGRAEVEQLVQHLRKRQEDLGLADLRSVVTPLGITTAAKRALDDPDLPRDLLQRGIEREALDRYLSDMGERRRIATRIELVLFENPFTVGAITGLSQVEDAIREGLPSSLRDDTELYLIGTTASIRDLRDITMQDQSRVEILVLATVFVILVVLLRQGFVSLYLLLSVLFSYYTTLGVTFALFWALDPAGFAGLDWKVSIFLFTILVAVGEDYNIFLMTRIHEEQKKHGPIDGMIRALTRTGPIISSCGIIMAGTFFSLMSGTLTEMKELGFALAFGVLLDTFVVRPILVPAFLMLLENGKIVPGRWRQRAQAGGWLRGVAAQARKTSSS